MTISNADFCSFITELVTRNPNLGIPALEDGLFRSFILYICLKGQEKGKEKETEKGKGKGKGELLVL